MKQTRIPLRIVEKQVCECCGKIDKDKLYYMNCIDKWLCVECYSQWALQTVKERLHYGEAG